MSGTDTFSSPSSAFLVHGAFDLGLFQGLAVLAGILVDDVFGKGLPSVKGLAKEPAGGLILEGVRVEGVRVEVVLRVLGGGGNSCPSRQG